MENLNLEKKYWKDFPLIAGVDEAGRGAIAGPIVVAGVIFPVGFNDPLIKDSKKLSPLQRKKALEIISRNALEVTTAIKNVREIEEKNPLEATKEGMREVITKLKRKPDLCLIDGKEEVKLANYRTLSVIAGDNKAITIAAASIVAKVLRDSIMEVLDKKFPFYNWKQNKGYPDKSHLQTLLKHEVSPLHRRTYEPIKSILKKDFNKELMISKYKLDKN